jgi:hypothetical protein
MTDMTVEIDLSSEALLRDLGAAERALGVEVASSEEHVPTDGGRVDTTRTHHLPYGGRTTQMRARFVPQGVGERAQKRFVKEIEIGEASFDDAVYIATDTPELTRAFVGVARVRAALAWLVSEHCIVDVDDEGLTITRREARGSADEEIAHALALYAHLA